MEQIIEEAELDEEQMKKVERQFASNYKLITDDDRLEKISEDIVDHFMNRGNSGKAIVSDNAISDSETVNSESLLSSTEFE